MHLDIPPALSEKLSVLHSILRDLDAVVVAFSGGVDSSVLLKSAVVACNGRVTALTALSPSFPDRERDTARAFVQVLGCEHLEIETEEMNEPKYRANAGDRCYYCRRSLFEMARLEIEAQGLGALIYGAIPEDLGEDRPGMRAADERHVRAPLIEAGLSKQDVRQIAKAYSLSVWNKPASACLASRFPTGTTVTERGLQQVEQCETLLSDLGFHQFRARYHGDLVRIELDEEGLKRVQDEPTLASSIEACGLEAGFSAVDIDSKGYRSGSVHTPTLITIVEGSGLPPNRMNEQNESRPQQR